MSQGKEPSESVDPPAVSTASAPGDVPTRGNQTAHLSQLEHFIRHFAARSSQEAASVLEEYVSTQGTETDWHFFVRHTWLPVLSVAYGSDWSSKFESELDAMVALHASLALPKTSNRTFLGTRPAEAAAVTFPGQCFMQQQQQQPLSPTSATPPTLPQSYCPSKQQQQQQQQQQREASEGALEISDSDIITPARPFATEAVDVDGKRRRLRRKRAASPEEAADAVPSPVAQSQSEKEEGQAGDGSRGEICGDKPTSPSAVMARVVQQISKLAMGSPAGSPSRHASGKLAAFSTNGGKEAATASSGAACGGVLGSAEEQQRLAGSLTLVHDISQRMLTGLRLSSDEALPTTEGEKSNGGGGGVISAADAADLRSNLANLDLSEAPLMLSTLQKLLGSSLGDRSDLLGRTALHVASASGQPNVVAALVAAGCDVNKRLPLDYRLLLRFALGGGGDSHGEVEMPAWPKRDGKLSTGALPPPPLPVSMQGSTALHWAAAGGDVATMEALLSSPDADVSARTIEGATAMHFAARGGHTAAVARLSRCPDIELDAADLQGRTALHVAAAAGHSGVVQQLWARGACIDPADAFSWRPLHYAAREGRAAVAAHLVIAGSQVQAHDPKGVTAAHLAAERGYVDILDRLLIAGYLPDAVVAPYSSGGDGTTALHLAATQGHAEAVAVLLRWAANPKAVDALRFSALDCAVINGHFHLAPMLLGAGCGMRRPRDIAEAEEESANGAAAAVAVEEHKAVAGGEGNESSTGAEKGGTEEQSSGGLTVPGNASDRSLAVVVLPPSPRVAELLRCLAAEDPAADPAFATATAAEPVFWDIFNEQVSFLACAAGLGKMGPLMALQQRQHEKHPPTPSDASTAAAAADLSQALLMAVRCGRWEATAWLLRQAQAAGDDLSAHALLHHAAVLGHDQVVGVLLEGGWDPAKRHLSMTPLQEAAAYGHVGIAQALLETNAGAAAVDAADQRGHTALHSAAAAGLTGLVEMLLEAGASPDAEAARDGLRPAHLAAREGHVGALHALLRAGASLGAVDSRGWTPLHFAAQRGDLAAFLLLHGRTEPLLTPASAAALLTAAVLGRCSEIVGVVLLGGSATPEACVAAKEAPAHAAAREGFVEALQFLADAGFDLCSKDAEQRSPLHHVPTGYGHALGPSRRGRPGEYVAAAELLLACGCAADAPDAHGCTPLHVAAGCGSPDILQRFLDLGPGAVNAADEIGWTPLFWAASEGHEFAVRMLLQAQANCNAEDCNQRMPLHFAAEGGHLGCVSALIDAHCMHPSGPSRVHNTDVNSQSAVRLAAEGGHVECVLALLDAVPMAPAQPDGTPHSLGSRDSGTTRRTALHLAAAQGLPTIVAHLLATQRLHPGAKDMDGWTPLHLAAIGNHADVIEQLLAASADADDPASDGDTALHKAALSGHEEAVGALLKGERASADVRNASGATPLYNAASQNHVEVMRLLLEAGAAPDAAASNGCTPLYIAANNGWDVAVRELLEQGAEVDLEATGGCTALHAAAANGHASVIRALADAGADVDAQSSNGSTPLHNASANGHVEAAEALLASGADTDVENASGNTPLHMAAGKGWAAVVEALVAVGADLMARNHKGYAPIQSAASGGYFDAVLKLVHSGGAWRQKGDGDVVKLLSRKTTLKVSYIEGRLRLAEKERQRRQAKGAAADGGAAGIGGGSGGANTATQTTPEDLEVAKKQADAVMAALLEEEQAEKAKVDRAKKKKEAKKQKKAAQRQAEAQAKAEEEEEEEVATAAEEEAATAAAAVEEAGWEADEEVSATDEAAPIQLVASAAALAGKGRSVAHANKPAANGNHAAVAPVANHAHSKHGASDSGAVAPKVAIVVAVGNGRFTHHPKPVSGPGRTASEGLASAPAMPVFLGSGAGAAARYAGAHGHPSASAAASVPAASLQQQPVKPSGPYAAALAGQQPPPPRPIVRPQVQPQQQPTGGAAAHSPASVGGGPWAGPALVAQQQQQQVPHRPVVPPATQMAPQPQQQQRIVQPAAAQLLQHHHRQAPPGMPHRMGPPLMGPQGIGYAPPQQMGPPPPQQQQQPRMAPIRPPPYTPHLPQAIPPRQQGGLSSMEGFVPLFGIDLPQLSASPITGIDWSLPPGAQHAGVPRPGSGLAPPPSSAPPSLFVPGMPPVSMGIPFSHGSSGSGGGMLHPHPHHQPTAAAAPMVPMADADGIDDVLRMQPWLQE